MNSRQNQLWRFTPPPASARAEEAGNSSAYMPVSISCIRVLRSLRLCIH